MTVIGPPAEGAEGLTVTESGGATPADAEPVDSTRTAAKPHKAAKIFVALEEGGLIMAEPDLSR
ncbi:hypothetical protein IMCC26207_110648 [Actinobacteria bacterium IMCC26207]|nr:hypothetical protein IMCC26207_110648 [Actinobacteria bacterium IMCC26207]